MTRYLVTGREPYRQTAPWNLITDQMGVGQAVDLTLSQQDEATLIAAGMIVPVSGLAAGEVVTVAGGLSPYPRILLDTFYDSSYFANKTAAINAAVAATQALGGVLEFRHGRVYSLDVGALSVAPSAGANGVGPPLKIKGNKATLQANWGKPRCIDFTKTVDYCQFADVIVDDLIFDANNLTASNHQSIVGNLIDGAISTRINATRIELNNCRWINVPVGGTGAITYQCFNLSSRHLASGETQTNLTEIHLRNARMRGGDVGAAVLGTGVSPPNTVEVYHDQIYLEVDHDTGVIPTNTSSGGANVQVGSVGWGDYCEVKINGKNSGDVGVEIDGMQTLICTGTVIDAKNTMFYSRNFHLPRSVPAQKNTYRDCVAITRNVDKATIGGTSKDFSIGGDTTTTYAFGEIVWDNCQSVIETPLADWPNSTALCVDVSQIYVRKVTIRNHLIACEALNTNPTSGHTYLFTSLWTSDPKGVLDVDGIHLVLAGSITNTTSSYYVTRLSSTAGQTTKLNIKNLTLDCTGITTTTLGSVTFYNVLIGTASSSFFSGTIENLKAINGSISAPFDLFRTDTNFHVPTGCTIVVRGCDSSLITTSSGADYSHAVAANHGLVVVESVGGRRNNAAAPFSAPTAIAGTASPFTYQNLDFIPEEVQVSGGTVSDISLSHDNSTFFTLGGSAGKWRLRPGDYIKVTYSGVPTMTKWPLA